MTRLSLKRRIALAIAAIVAIHAAFYVGPRLWYSWPRFYPQGYAQAVSILRETFGDAAVDKGVVTIPRESIVVPYEGAKYAGCCYLRLEGDSVTLLTTGFPKARVAHVKGKAARDLWAEWKYLENVRIDTPNTRLLGGDVRFKLTWYFEIDYEPRNDSEREAFNEYLTVCEILERAQFKRVIERPNIAFTEDPKAVQPVVRALARGGLRVRSPYYYVDVRDAYFEHLDKGELAFLKRLDRKAHRKAPGWVATIPAVGDKLRRWYEGQGRCFCGEIWEFEQLRGKSPAEQVAILSEAALGRGAGNSGLKISRKDAMAIFAKGFPDEWRKFVMAKGFVLGPQERCSAIPKHGQVKPSDEEFLRFACKDPERFVRVCARSALYSLTKDAADLDAFMAEADPVNPQYTYAHDFVRQLLEGELCPMLEEDAAVREVLARTLKLIDSAWSASCTWSEDNKCDFTFKIFEAVCRSDGDFASAFADELLNDPQKVLSADVPASRVDKLRMAALMDGSKASTEALVAYAWSALACEPAPGAVEQLACLFSNRGDRRALPALEALLASEERRADDGSDAEAARFRDYDRRMLREGVIFLKLKSASDPLAYLRSLASEERASVYRYAFEELFTREEVQGLLVDESLEDFRGEILHALDSTLRDEFRKRHPDAKRRYTVI